MFWEIQNFVNPKQNTHFFCVFCFDCVVTHFSSSSSFGLGETTTKKKDDDEGGREKMSFGGAAKPPTNGGGGGGGFFRQLRALYELYANQTKELSEIRSATARLEKRREEFQKMKRQNEKNSERSMELLRDTVRGLEMQFQTLEREKREVEKVVDAIGDGAEKKLREKFEREERELGKRVEELLEKEGLFGEATEGTKSEGDGK